MNPRNILALQLPKLAVVFASYFSVVAVMGDGGNWYSHSHHILIIAIAVYLMVSILVRNLLMLERLSLTVLTAWVLFDTALAVVAWGAAGWRDYPVFTPMLMAGEAAIVGFSLWRGAAHFGVTAALVAVAPLTNPYRYNPYWKDYLLPMLPGLAFVYAFVYLAGTMQAEREAAARARTEAELANAHLREYANQVEEVSVLRERNRLAREVHDTVAHGFTGIIMQVEGIARIWKSEPQAAEEALMQVRDQARESLNEVRRSVHALRPQQLQDRNGIAAIRKLVDEFTATTGVHADLVVEGLPAELPAAHDLCLYRAVQEGLTNAFRHGRAQRARVRVGFEPDRVWLAVEDDGRGAAGPVNGGLGIVGIRERAEVLGGSVEAGTAATGGFVLQMTLPLQPGKTGGAA